MFDDRLNNSARFVEELAEGHVKYLEFLQWI